MRAIILAGGKGTRLKPYTTLIPKPLVPIGGEVSILEIVIRQLVESGFTHLTLAVNHLANLIMAFIGDGSKWRIKIDYSVEETPLNTIGPLTILNNLPEDFLVMNGDILSNLDYRNFLKEHIAQENLISVSSFKRETKIDYGVITLDSNNGLESFSEKPTYSHNVSMGIYCFKRSVIEKLPKGKPYGFDELMLDSIKSKQKVWIKTFEGFWLDVGRPEDYQYADENYSKIKSILGWNK